LITGVIEEYKDN